MGVSTPLTRITHGPRSPCTWYAVTPSERRTVLAPARARARSRDDPAAMRGILARSMASSAHDSGCCAEPRLAGELRGQDQVHAHLRCAAHVGQGVAHGAAQE